MQSSAENNKLLSLRRSPTRAVDSERRQDQGLEVGETPWIPDLHPLLHPEAASALGREKSSFDGRLFNRLL